MAFDDNQPATNRTRQPAATFSHSWATNQQEKTVGDWAQKKAAAYG